MKATDLREKSAADLNELSASLRTDVFQNRLKNFTNRLDDTSMIRKTKRDLARVLTLLRAQAPVAAPAVPAAPVAKKPAKAKAPKAEVKAAAVAAPPAPAAADAPAAPKKAPKKSAKKSEAK
jgi:large subunit ribosomal protein L29